MKKSKLSIIILSLALAFSLSLNYVLYRQVSSYENQARPTDQGFVSEITSLIYILDDFISKYQSDNSSNGKHKSSIEEYQKNFAMKMDKVYYIFMYTSYTRYNYLRDCFYNLYWFFTYKKSILTQQAESIRNYLKSIVASKNDFKVFATECKKLNDYLQEEIAKDPSY